MVSTAEGEGRRRGRDREQAPPGGGSPHPHGVLPARRHPLAGVFCAAGRDGVRRLEGHERQPERAAGVYAAAGNREAGGGAGEALPRLAPCSGLGWQLHLLDFELPGLKVLSIYVFHQFLCGCLVQQVHVCQRTSSTVGFNKS